MNEIAELIEYRKSMLLLLKDQKNKVDCNPSFTNGMIHANEIFIDELEKLKKDLEA
jgi:hypothetical protein